MALGSDWWCRVIGECNCRLLDALAKTKQGCARNAVFYNRNGCGWARRWKVSDGQVRAVSALCPRYVRALFALCSRKIAMTGEFRACGKKSNVRFIVEGKVVLGSDWWCRVFGNVTADCRRLTTEGPRWRWAAIGGAVLLGNATADW